MDEYKNGNINGESRADGTGQERKVLSALKSAPHVYFLLSMCTRAPYVLCDPETFDDEILVFLDREASAFQSRRFRCRWPGWRASICWLFIPAFTQWELTRF